MVRYGAYWDGKATTFHVWAPNAKKVAVTLFPDLKNVVLKNEGAGHFSGASKDARPGAQYELALTLASTHSGSLVKRRMDPAARDTIDSSLDNWANKSIIVDTTHDWTPFASPKFDDYIVYQCHVGSFAGRNDHLPISHGIADFDTISRKIGYIRGLGFNAIALLPVQEFRFRRSWGYNPSFFFALESAYGNPKQLRHFVDACHREGIAVLFDVVYNHISDADSSFYNFDESIDSNGSYVDMSQKTPWGHPPKFRDPGVRDFFLENIRMYFNEYNADGLRFDSTRTLEATRGKGNDGWEFMLYLIDAAKREFPGKYLIAEHIPDHDTIIDAVGFHAAWAKGAYDRFFAAMTGQSSMENIESVLENNHGYGQRYKRSHNLVKYLLGSHDECGDMDNGNRRSHRYLVELLGGRQNWHARAKARMAWALNIAIEGTPMLFMGNECHMPGYWHDGPDDNGDHRFDWHIAGDLTGLSMRKLVTAANHLRRSLACLRDGALEVTHRDPRNQILAFKRYNRKGEVALVVVNPTDVNWTQRAYGVRTGQEGRWTQALCSQDPDFGGWHEAGNAFYEPWTQPDGNVYVNVPKYSVTIFTLAE